ncbi:MULTISPECIES: GGDEF domain-containing protein [Dehalobacter]|uniref:Diguanylate cyclase n=1 Tax=Dehalobacter restrictus (strain DSM 9455 / PER-K23) TaxID=871738 RepID=A0ABM5P8U5_DEHRP|nr:MULTISPECIES: GGDEF domain-containing protein [Dehalobacter]AHF10970.1 diguanylate cyclase [Dehalobacter restrictus DSM 9455]MDJ0307082.1 GGDEF domain-containing protein [Dehalobacter sp.]OCZ49621.1 diguanylate cyclase [Dehalobacter sp. TeCB1]
MFYAYLNDQAAVIIILCFSFLNLAFVFTMNKEKSFSALFGFSFIAPFLLALLSIAYPDMVLRIKVLHHTNFAFLCLLLILILSWRWKNYAASAALSVIFPFLVLFTVMNADHLPVILTMTEFLGGAAVVLAAGIIILLHRFLGEKQISLTWGVIFMGFGQLLQYEFPTNSSFLIPLCQFAGYLLFYCYIQKTLKEPYRLKLANAEEKLVNINKTINYEVKRKMLEMELHNEHLLNMVQRDPLVDAYNKKGIMNYFKNLIDDPKTGEFTLMLFDIDNFKSINDNRGHVVGDMVLKKVVSIAKENIREFDILGRYGGDEFLVILPKTKITDALIIAERFRKRVSEEPDISVSIGLAAYPEDGRTAQNLIETADAGLYQSKRVGKNAINHVGSKI